MRRRELTAALCGGFCSGLMHQVTLAQQVPYTTAKAWVILDFSSEAILAQKKCDSRRQPASLTKLMTSYVVFDAIARKEVRWDEKVVVTRSDISKVASDEARMHLVPGQNVSIENLMTGLIVGSANDAAHVLASRIAGDEIGFVDRMNAFAVWQGLLNSRFANPTGVTAQEQFSSAKDLALLCLNLVKHFPEYLSFSSRKDFSYEGFTKRNKNRVLGKDPSVDGMKTGHTAAAGWCIAATALRSSHGSPSKRRIFTVLLGADSDNDRISSAQGLLNYAYDTLAIQDASNR